MIPYLLPLPIIVPSALYISRIFKSSEAKTVTSLLHFAGNGFIPVTPLIGCYKDIVVQNKWNSLYSLLKREILIENKLTHNIVMTDC